MRRRHRTNGQMGHEAIGHPYQMFAIDLLLSQLIMYFAMFAMIWSAGEFIQNVNFFYMALIMWAPMAIIMMLTMKSMFMSGKVNAVLYLLFAAVFGLSFVGIRAQTLVGDREFLRSMIPHHSGAVPMCRRSAIRDPEIRELCFGPNGIIAQQSREIVQMKALQRRLQERPCSVLDGEFAEQDTFDLLELILLD